MKGQSSMEFLAYVSFTMLILAALYTVMIDKQQDTLRQQTERNAELVSERTSFEVEMALVQGEGYSRVFALPASLGGENYTVELLDGSTRVTWGDQSMISSSRYEGDEINISVDDDSNIVRVLYNESGVNLVAAE